MADGHKDETTDRERERETLEEVTLLSEPPKPFYLSPTLPARPMLSIITDAAWETFVRFPNG